MSKWARGISIIGAAYTPFGNVLETPSIKGMSHRELLSWASLEALENAGIAPKDVDSLLVANFMTDTIKTKCIHAVAADWLGMKKKPSIHFETACGGSAAGVRMAGSLIASGIDDIVLLVGVEICNSVIDENPKPGKQQAYSRLPVDPNDLFTWTMEGADYAYSHPFALDQLAAGAAFPIMDYSRKHGLTIDQIDEAQSAACINLRRNAARNPRALHREEYAEIAKREGFNSVMDYMKSSYNPFICWPVRAQHMYTTVDGASALVLCPAEDAKKYTKTPVDVLGVGLAAGHTNYPDPNNLETEKASFEQAYKMANLNPNDIEYLGLHDCSVQMHMTTAEMAGYFGPGKAWQAVMEGRTAFDGDKPINTHGGTPSMGNAYDVSSIAEICEPVMQMRGECGERQMTRPPKIAVCAAAGMGITYGVTVIGRRD